MQNPTVVFVPGAWHCPEHYSPVVKDLEKHGFPAFTVALPSVGGNPPVTSLQPDVDAISAAITSVLDEGKDVIAVFHSYGGVPGTEAVGKIVKTPESTGEAKGHIKHLVYMSSQVPFEGQSLGAVMTYALNGYRLGPVETWEVPYWDYDNGLMVPNDNVIESFYHDVTEESAARAQSLLKGHSAATFTATDVTVAGWRYVPSTYVYATDDKAVALSVQEAIAKRAKEEDAPEGGVKAFDGPLGEVYIDAGHCALVMDRAEEFSKVIRTVGGSA